MKCWKCSLLLYVWISEQILESPGHHEETVCKWGLCVNSSYPNWIWREIAVNLFLCGVLLSCESTVILLSALSLQVGQQGWCPGSLELLAKAWLPLLWMKNFSRKGERKWVGSQKTLGWAWPKEEKASYGYGFGDECLMCQLAWKSPARKFDIFLCWLINWTGETGSGFIGDSV